MTSPDAQASIAPGMIAVSAQDIRRYQQRLADLRLVDVDEDVMQVLVDLEDWLQRLSDGHPDTGGPR